MEGVGRNAGQVAYRRSIARPDIERLAVQIRRDLRCRINECLADVIDVDKVARNVRVDERGYSPFMPLAIRLGISREVSSKGP